MSDKIKFNELAQEMYNRLYAEVMDRYRITGANPPSEVDIFKKLVQGARDLINLGEVPKEFLDSLKEVKPQIAIEKDKADRLEKRENALKNGYVIDLDDLK